MKLTGKQIGITATAGITGMFAGVLLISGGIRIQLLSLAGLLALPPIAVGLIVADTRAQGKVNQAEAKANEAQRKLDGVTIKLTASEEKEARVQLELAEVQTSLNRAKELLKACEVERSQSAEVIGQQYVKIDSLQAALVSHQERVEELEAEIEVWEEEFHSKVNIEAENRFQTAKLAEIKRIETENDALTKEAIDIARQYRQWVNLADARLQDRREFVESITDTYNSKISDFGQSYSKQVAGYLDQIEILNCKVAMLQQKLQGDLIEPEYLAVAYSVEGRIANDIAREIFTTLQIPLVVRGYHTKPDGCIDVGYGYSRSMESTALIEALKRQSEAIARELRIHKITSIRKLEIADLIVLSFRRAPSVKEDTIKLIAGTPDQFLEYVASHPIRYRLIADPGTGKTPITAVMVSEILKVGGTRGNTGKGRKIPNMLVTVSCPDVESSQKDADYPLEVFLKYGNTTAAVKSFFDADEDWKYRKRDTNYANEFFQLWVWDELDNTLNNTEDPKAVGEKFKNFLKQAHHTGVGWIVSGQSVMTKQIPGFMDDDRELFTQIIIGTSKIRKYLEKYGKKILSAKVVTQLLNNLDDLEPYIEDKNSLVTDAARLLRLALVLDDKSPKLYFLPNLDNVNFDVEKLETVITQADQMKRQFLVRASGGKGEGWLKGAQNPYCEGVGEMVTEPPFPTIGGFNHSSQSSQIPHCPHCGGSDLKVIESGKRYRCQGCTKRFVSNKTVWK
jgi:hypothetical protein